MSRTERWTSEEAAAVFAKHRRVVERTAYRILKDREEASDVASETFLSLLEHGPADRKSALAWLITSARNRSLNRIRDRATHSRLAHHVIPETAADDARGQGVAEAAALVEIAALRLDERQRQAVRLRHVEEASYEEISATLGVSAAHARVLVHRAVRRLRSETVSLLAEHHGAPASCKRALERGSAHRECSSCVAVSDEMSAMQAMGVVPVFVPPAAWLIAKLGRAHDTVTRYRIGGGSRTAEAVLALVMGATILPGATLPAHAGSAHVGLPVRQPVAIRNPAMLLVEPRAHPAATPAVNPAWRRDVLAASDGDDHVLPSDSRLPEQLRILDALDPTREAGLDIRTFSIRPMRSSSGESDGLTIRFDLAGPPKPDFVYVVQWTMESGCRGQVITSIGGISSPNRSLLQMNCNDGGDESPSPGGTTLPFTVEGDSVVVTMTFSALEGSAGRALVPSALMMQVRAITENDGTNGAPLAGDVAPDRPDEYLEYRIPR